MKRALVTGSNRGIGLEIVKQLLDRDYSIVAACRSASEELEALKAKAPGAIEIVPNIDVTDPEAIRRLRAGLGEQAIELLVLNAGILLRTGLSEIDDEAVRRQFEVNALAPLRMVSMLHGKMPEGGRIALITSRMGSIADNTSGGSYGYRMSKAALNAAGKSLAEDLKPLKISVAILHPGWVKTEMTGQTGNVTAAESAAGLVQRMEELSLENSGRFLHMNGEELPW